MSLVINQNMMALNAARNLSNSIQGPMRVQTNRDDAAGLAVREIQRAEIKSLDSPDAQPTAAAPETAPEAQGAAAGSSAAQAAPKLSEELRGQLLDTTDTGLGMAPSRAQMDMKIQNIQAQNANVMGMMNSTAQPIGNRLRDPMMDPSLTALSPQWSRTEPLLNAPSGNTGTQDQGVEALRSLFKVTG